MGLTQIGIHQALQHQLLQSFLQVNLPMASDPLEVSDHLVEMARHLTWVAASTLTGALATAASVAVERQWYLLGAFAGLAALAAGPATPHAVLLDRQGAAHNILRNGLKRHELSRRNLASGE